MVRVFSSGNPKLGDKEKRLSKETVKEESERKQETAVLDIKTKRTELQGGQSDPEGKSRAFTEPGAQDWEANTPWLQ